MPTPKPPRPADSEDELPEPHLAQPPRYIIYLLTVWFDESSGNDPTNCRFRLENPRTKQGKGFVGVEALVGEVTTAVQNEVNHLYSSSNSR